MRDQPPVMDDHDLVRELRHLGEHVARDEDGAPAAAKERRKSRSQRIPSGSRPFAGSSSTSSSRDAEQRARDAQALPHSERVAADLPPCGAAQLHLREYLVHARELNAAGEGEHPQVVSPRPRRVEAVGLEHRADLPQRLGQVPVRLTRDLASPAVGRTSPSTARNVVVLPAPLGPRKPVIRPAGIAKDRSSTAVVEPYRFVSAPNLDRRPLGHQPASRSTSR